MYSIITGIADNDEIEYCPRCGEEVTQFYLDGTVGCKECGFHFGVVECEDD